MNNKVSVNQISRGASRWPRTSGLTTHLLIVVAFMMLSTVVKPASTGINQNGFHVEYSGKIEVLETNDAYPSYLKVRADEHTLELVLGEYKEFTIRAARSPDTVKTNYFLKASGSSPTYLIQKIESGYKTQVNFPGQSVSLSANVASLEEAHKIVRISDDIRITDTGVPAILTWENKPVNTIFIGKNNMRIYLPRTLVAEDFFKGCSVQSKMVALDLGCSIVTPKDLLLLSKQKVTSISVSNRKVDDYELFVYSKLLPNSLELKRCQLSSEKLNQLLPIVNLQALIVPLNRIDSYTNHFPVLKYLDLSGNIELKRIRFSKDNQLEYLSAASTELTLASFTGSHYPKLTELNLSFTPLLNNKDIVPQGMLGNIFPKLEALEIEGCTLNNETTRRLGGSEPLKSLNIANNFEITELELDRFPNLESISLDYSLLKTPTFLDQLKSAKHLKTVNVYARPSDYSKAKYHLSTLIEIDSLNNISFSLKSTL